MFTTAPTFLTATEQARLIRGGQLSARENLEAHLDQIARVNPKVNAIPTLVADQARAAALAADERQARGEPLGALHGLPIAHKDLQETAGIRTTYGSLIHEHNVPTFDTLTVTRLKQAGAITVGKSNTPELGAGSQTFNPVFGATHNPYDVTKTCGGSSGGAAVALACGMLPIADGSDMGGSLRNPASFCNVVGLRSSPGRVPIYPRQNPWATLSVDGPMARTVADVALMLSALAGPDPRVPISINEPGARFAEPLDKDMTGVRIAWFDNLGGVPFDSRVTDVVRSNRAVFEAMGCIVEQAEPDLGDANGAFKTLRAWSFHMSHGAVLAQHRHQMKDTVIWNIEQGAKLTGQQVAQAVVDQGTVFNRMRTFLEKYDFFVLPVVQVPPFDVTLAYPTEINGQPMETYIDWMKSCYLITTTLHPAISVPCGFTAEGLPIGLQIVGRYADEWSVLQLAHAFEQATGWWKRKPSIA